MAAQHTADSTPRLSNSLAVVKIRIIIRGDNCKNNDDDAADDNNNNNNDDDII